MKYVLIAIGVIAAVWVLGTVTGLFGEATKVAHDELGPQAAYDKYTWFIEQHERVRQMDTQIESFKLREAAVDQQYAAYGTNRAAWPPHISMQYNQAKQQARDDVVAMVAQRNGLARDYNAASQNFTWRPFKSKPDFPGERIDEYVLQ